VRQRYRFVVVGYVIMPEHIHLLISEPERDDPSKAMQAIKPGLARQIPRKARDCGSRIWQAPFYDFVVFTEKKRVEKLRYMHRNPVKRGLVLEPQQWKWSSYRHYAEGVRGIVLVNEERKAELKIRNIA
jgi:putative transposase